MAFGYVDQLKKPKRFETNKLIHFQPQNKTTIPCACVCAIIKPLEGLLIDLNCTLNDWLKDEALPPSSCKFHFRNLMMIIYDFFIYARRCRAV